MGEPFRSDAREDAELMAFERKLLCGAMAFIVTIAAAAVGGLIYEDAYWTRIRNVMLGEAASEGYEGMAWVACTMRHRGWDLGGYAASRREDLETFVERQPWNTVLAADAALLSVRRGYDCRGANHHENVEANGAPSWSRGKKPVAAIGRHTFWRI